MRDEKIAVLLPCYNESATIAKVVRDFRAALPESDICPIPGHDVFRIGPEQHTQQKPDQAVPKIMEHALVLREIRRGQPVAHGHVSLSLQNGVN